MNNTVRDGSTAVQSVILDGPMAQDCVSVSAAAKEVGFTHAAVLGWIRNGILPAWEVGGSASQYRRLYMVSLSQVREVARIRTPRR